MKHPWQYDEMKQVGTDYSSEEEVAAYDERMSKFRDFESEIADIANSIDLQDDQALIDFGCGTGKAFPFIAPLFKDILAYLQRSFEKR